MKLSYSKWCALYLFFTVSFFIGVADRTDWTLETGSTGNGRNLTRIAVIHFHCAALALGTRFQRTGPYFSTLFLSHIIVSNRRHNFVIIFDFHVIETVVEHRILE